MQFGRRLPYQYIPPAPRPILARLIWPYIGHRLIAQKYQVKRLQARGFEKYVELQREGHSLVMTSNHPAHIDGWTLGYSAHRSGFKAHFVTDYANYSILSRAHLAAMKVMGVFSIDPHGFDRQSFRESMSILAGEEKGGAIAFFPEGNIFLHNDFVKPYRHGAFLLAVRAARKLRNDPGREIYVSPVGIKFSFLTDARDTIEAVVAGIQDSLGLARRPLRSEPLPVLRGIGIALANHHLEAVGASQRMTSLSDLPSLIAALLEELESAYNLTADPSHSDHDRTDVVRREFYRRINAAPNDADAYRHSGGLDLIERLTSYHTAYACDLPTLDRIGEVVANFYEDLYNEPLNFGVPLACEIRWAPDPIHIQGVLDGVSVPKRAISRLADEARRATQASIDEINARTSYRGSRLWNDLATRVGAT